MTTQQHSLRLPIGRRDRARRRNGGWISLPFFHVHKQSWRGERC